ncbi:NADPH-dependent FMN reductase [Spirosoma liriopis]|nr:NADPH-dependent FMN reductase [Spirosoma liriopis]
MVSLKNVLILIGSASNSSSNLQLMKQFAERTQDRFSTTIFQQSGALPPFNPQLAFDNCPELVQQLRDQISHADVVVICTPEYLFSIPSRLKNILEWCVSTTVFANKPVGLITASADGQRGHIELQLIMQTLMARFTAETTLLISAVKGKLDSQGNVTDEQTDAELSRFIAAFGVLMDTQA